VTTPDIASNVALDHFNTLGLKARAARYCKITAPKQLKALFDSDAWGTGPALVLGGGSNLVLSGDVDGLVLHIAIGGCQIDDSSSAALRILVGAGENWDAVVRRTLALGQGGLENLISIPGSSGAAPVQNIGAYGLELSERVTGVHVFDRDSGQFRRLAAGECEFGYRDSIFKRHPSRYIITGVELALPRPWTPVLGYRDLQSFDRATTTPQQIADAVSSRRAEKLPDPAVFGNVGSFFKNPLVSSAQFQVLSDKFPGMVSFPQADGTVKLAAAWLIEQAGLKGATRGAAAVHERQALVLVNRGGATARDILGLAQHVRQVVMQRYGVALEQEPVLV
jgi:UDP-N-acetylmuramate dehydrogenase